MKIAVLSFKRNFYNYENKAFINSALKNGVNLKLVDPDACTIKIIDGKIKVFYEDKDITNIDYLLIRVGCMINTHIRHVIDAFKYNGVIISVETNDISMFADKFSTHLKLANVGLKSINSIKSRNLGDYNLKYPTVFKSNTGSLGLGIYKANNEHDLKNLVAHSKLLDNMYDYIIQDYIEESFGEDLRVYVVNKKILGVMNRKSDGIDFRANFALHSNANTYEVNEKIENIVNIICENVKSDILGVDLLFKNGEYLVCEINSAPGFKGFEKVYPSIKVGDLIINEIKKIVKEKGTK